MNLREIESELKKRWRLPYDEDGVRVDIWQDLTHFVKNIDEFGILEDEIFQRFGSHKRFTDLKNYAVNRWYNHVSEKALTTIFKEHSRVRISSSMGQKHECFYIEGMPFQLRIFEFNSIFEQSREEVVKEKNEFAHSLLKNSDIETSVIYVAISLETGHVSRLRCELLWLKEKFDAYLDEFDKRNIARVNRGGHISFADLLVLHL